jgi:hypothetical protein
VTDYLTEQARRKAWEEWRAAGSAIAGGVHEITTAALFALRAWQDAGHAWRDAGRQWEDAALRAGPD